MSIAHARCCKQRGTCKGKKKREKESELKEERKRERGTIA